MVGGDTRRREGWFVDPTVLEVADPDFAVHHRGALRAGPDRVRLRRRDWDGDPAPGRRVDAIRASPARCSPKTSRAVVEAADALRYTAGNFYVNDKPTGSVVGQQPFGGARASGTNDKAGTVWNLIRFASPRA